MIKQGERSYDQNLSCSYRGLNGLKCPVGWLISDKEYDDEMENKTSSALIVEGYLKRYASIEGLLSDLQKVHDCYEPEAWFRKLMDVAVTHELDPKKLIKTRRKLQQQDEFIKG